MARGIVDRINDIVTAIPKCRGYIDFYMATGSGHSDLVEDAVERNLEIIGEAVKFLPVEILDAHPEIPWPRIIGLRSILVHEYFGVDISIVRDVVENHLPILSSALEEEASKWLES